MYKQENQRYPIITMGMHRSGTSLVSRTIEHLGVYQGADKDRNNEATLFGSINSWLLRVSGGSTEFPEAMDYMLSNSEIRKLVNDCIHRILRGYPAIQYLGIKNYLKYRGLTRRLDYPWGWKDPRNTLTLPIWLEQFPRAKVVYVERHGVDVAASYRKRRLLDLRKSCDRYQKTKHRYYIVKKRSGFPGTRGLTLEGAFSLWEEYTCRGRAAVKDLGADRAITINYENMVRYPIDTIRRLAEFICIKPSEEQLWSSITQFNTERVLAFRSSAELLEFANKRKDRLLGYEVS